METLRYYTTDSFNNSQLSEILEGLHSGIDVSVYCDPAYSAFHMHKIREASEAGKDISILLNPGLGLEMVGVLQFALLHDIDCKDYLVQDFSASQLHEIVMGQVEGLDVSHYANPAYAVEQMQVIRRGLKAGIPTAMLENVSYSVQNMNLICAALIDGLPVEKLIPENGNLPDNFKEDIVKMSQEDHLVEHKHLKEKMNAFSLLSRDATDLITCLQAVGYKIKIKENEIIFIPPARKYEIVMNTTMSDLDAFCDKQWQDFERSVQQKPKKENGIAIAPKKEADFERI